MKKILIISVLCAFAMVLHAQDDYAPVEGNFAVGFDASPMFRYVGNIFNGMGTDGLTFNNLDPLAGEPTMPLAQASIFGKYMYSDKIGIVANIGLLGRNSKIRAYVQDDKALILNPLSQDRVVDIVKRKRTGVSLLLGGEYRIGEGRIQGVFGGGLLLTFVKNRETFTWGNEMTELNQNPTSTGGANPDFVNAFTVAGQRNTEFFNAATNVGFGVVGNAGVEYFIAPRVALGAQVNLYAYWQKDKQMYRKYETYNAGAQRVEDGVDLVGPGNSGFQFGTQNLGGSLYISFYF